MARAITLTKSAYQVAQTRRLELVRSAIVIGCGVALILAGQATPF